MKTKTLFGNLCSFIRRVNLCSFIRRVRVIFEFHEVSMVKFEFQSMSSKIEGTFDK